MDAKDLRKADLNLLISLQVLLQEKSVSRAAERLHITQPAMSKTLGRLRALFGDPLFIRVDHRMQPTPRAIDIGLYLDAILEDISQLLGADSFHPQSFSGNITLALSENVGVALLPPLTKKLCALAPGLSIRVISRLENPLQELTAGNLDFAIQIKQPHYSADFRTENLGSSPLTLMVREGHPLSKGKLNWKRLAEFPLIKLYVPHSERKAVQKSTSARLPIGVMNPSTLEISTLLSALEVLRQTNYFMPAPAYLLQRESTRSGIVGLSMPIEGTLQIDYTLVAHARTANSPMHNWLWEQITCTIAELQTPLRHTTRRENSADTADELQ